MDLKIGQTKKEYMNKERIGFREQFIECSNNGLTEQTEFHSFEDNIDFLPLFPNKKMKEAITSGEWKGIDLIICGKFGGFCNSGNEQCRKLRNVI